MGRLGGPGSGVGFLRIVALLEAGAPEVDCPCGPIVTVRGELADDDPEPRLSRRQRPGDLESLPGSRKHDLRWAGEVSILNSSLSFAPIAFANASSVMYRVSALLPAIISSGLSISSIWSVASKRIRSTRLLVVYLKVELGCACVFQ